MDSIATALTLVGPSDTIVLGPGVYEGTANTDVTVPHTGLTLVGLAGAHSTVIRCTRAPCRGIAVDSSTGAAGITLEGLTIRDGVADTGGCLLAAAGAVVRLRSVRFVNCTATGTGGGGAVAVLAGAAIAMEAVEVLNCTATNGDGGGILLYPGSTTPTAVANATMRGCAATRGRGGGLAALAPVAVTNTLVAGCQASSGGGLWLGAAATTLRHSRLEFNSGVDGGALKADGAVLTVAHTVMLNNTAEQGGAMALHGGSAEVQECTARGNSARNVATGGLVRVARDGQYDGGALWVGGSAHVVVRGGSFNQGTAARGGAIATLDSTVMVCEGATLEGNVASNTGGAVFASYTLVPAQAETSVQGSLVQGNR